MSAFCFLLTEEIRVFLLELTCCPFGAYCPFPFLCLTQRSNFPSCPCISLSPPLFLSMTVYHPLLFSLSVISLSRDYCLFLFILFSRNKQKKQTTKKKDEHSDAICISISISAYSSLFTPVLYLTSDFCLIMFLLLSPLCS